jgi:hypothetical protein
MKTILALLSLVLVAVLVTGCNGLVEFNQNAKTITPSNVIVSDTRQASGFNGIDFRTFGHVILSQGDTESLVISGSDNVVPLVQTSVKGGALVIQMQDNINVIGIDKENVLTFNITVKDLAALNISGFGKVDMESLETQKLAITMSGAGQVVLNNLTSTSLNVIISGAGNVEIAGETTDASINISGAGPVDAPDLKIGTANVTISGLGGATLWVTDQLTGDISGAGSVSYYGDPQTNTKVTGVGNFRSLGSK